MSTMPALLLLVALLPQTPAAPTRAQIIAASKDIVAKARFCTFITVAADGQPQARVVDPIQPGDDFVIWFATNPLTRKVGEIRMNPKVTLSCFDSSSASYITLIGRADLITDPQMKRAHWKLDWAAIYPKGPLSMDVTLVRISPVRLEISSESRGIKNDPKTWRPASIEFPKR